MTPAHKRSGDGIPCVALQLVLSRVSFKPGRTINAVFELSVYNHSNGTYYGGKGSILNLVFKHTCRITAGIPYSYA